jgi:histidinol-phosphate aminotransferase
MSHVSRRVHLRPAITALPAYVPGARVPVGAAAFKLSSNENPYPPLASVQAAIIDAASDINRYPDMYATELTGALAAELSLGGVGAVTPDQVVVGNGSVGLLSHIIEAVVDAGDEVIYPWRSFEAYPIIVSVAGGTSVPVPLADPGHLDLAAMSAAVTDRTRVILVCTPNNPSGSALTQAELMDFIATIPTDVLIVVDEAYLEFVRMDDPVDGLAALVAHPNVVVLRTFSKAYGLAGLRVGYAVARARLATGIRSASTPFGVSHIAQRAALASLLARDELLDRVDAIVAERTRLVNGLRDQGWDLPDSQANFVWMALGSRTAQRAAEASAVGVVVRPFAGEGIRVSVGEREATDLFLKVAQAWR